jgi:pimeloyl-ACP methyl ester carboxylesterase
MRAVAQALQSYGSTPAKFSKVAIPVLLLLGSESPAHFRQFIEALHDVLPHSRIVVFPGQRHIAMDRAPDIFVREVTAFLNE